MYLYDNPLWIKDIEEVLNNLPDISILEGHTILITGASGLICSSIVDLLLHYNDFHENKIQILAAGRSYEKMKARFGNCVERNDFTFVQYDAADLEYRINEKADYIIHGAGNAYPALIMKEPVETMISNFIGMKTLLDHAGKHGTKRVLYVSSSEVYGPKNNNLPYKENEYGGIDILNPRNSYSIGKCAAETLCASYSEEYGVDTVIVRPGHIYGPTASKNDNRVSSVWAYQAARKEDITMKSDGSQIRSYCYSVDCAAAILTVLVYGEKKNAYNISNINSIISIKQMAEILSEVSGVSLHTVFADQKDKKGFNPMTNSSLNSEKLESLGWRPCFDAYSGFSHTIAILKQ